LFCGVDVSRGQVSAN